MELVYSRTQPGLGWHLVFYITSDNYHFGGIFILYSTIWSKTAGPVVLSIQCLGLCALGVMAYLSWNPMVPNGLLQLFNHSISYEKPKCMWLLSSEGNTALGEPSYIFTGSWALANGLPVWSAIWYTIEWQIKVNLLWGLKLWKQIMSANETILAVSIDGQSPFPVETEYLSLHCSDCCRCCLDSSSYQIGQYIHHYRLGTK